MSNVYKGSKTDFSYLVGMSLQRRMPWGTLASLLKDLAPTLEETRDVISILLKELESLQLSLQKKEKEVETFQKQGVDDDIQDQNNITPETSNKDPNNSLEAIHEKNQLESVVSKTESIEDEIEVLGVVKESIDEKMYLDLNESPKSLETNEQDSDNDDGSSEKEIDNIWYTFVKNGNTFGSKTEAPVQDKEFYLETEPISSNKSEDDHDTDKSLKDIDNKWYTFVANDKKQDFETEITIESEEGVVNKAKKRYHCTFCQKSFQTSSCLKSHVRIHTGEVPFECKTCKKRFKENGKLKIHERIHTGELPYECKSCNKRFNQIGNLKKHERIHTGEVPYVCKTCQKRFKQSQHLKNHERIHTGEVPYECKTCYKRFKQIGHLKKHEMIH